MDEYNDLDEAQLAYLKLLIDAGCKVLFKTYLPRDGWSEPKPYVMMRDSHKQHFLEPIPEALPTYSVNGQTGEVSYFSR